MSPTVSIRELRADEHDLWRRLRTAALADAPDAFGPTLGDIQQRTAADWRRDAEYVAAQRSASILIGELDGVAVATAYVSCRSEPGLAGLGAMWVVPECRGNRVATALIDTALAWAADHGCQTMELSVTVGNDAARRLYEHAGFEATGERRALRNGSTLEIELLRRPVNPQPH